MRNKILLIAFLVALIPFAALAQNMTDFQKGLKLFQSGVKTWEAMQPIGPKEEQMIGRAVAEQVFLRYGPISNNPGLVRYVNLIGETVAARSGRNDINYRFAVVENNREANAFAAPGGYVFITTGLLSKISNEAQLAGVLAHEVAHVSKKHMLDTIQRSKQLSGLTEITATALDKDPQALSRIVSVATDTLFTNGLDHKYEYEADVAGTEYAAGAGYDPRGLDEFLIKLKTSEGQSGSIFFQTHPPTGNRISKLEQNILPSYKSGGARLENRFVMNVR